MGNWRTVNLRGTLAPEHVQAVREFIARRPDWSNFHCLTANDALCGLGMWAGEEIHADGNLAERDYSVEDGAEVLRRIVEIAPSLTLKVHCGDEDEATNCVATITAEAGSVSVREPERAEVAPVSEDLSLGRLFRTITTKSGEVR